MNSNQEETFDKMFSDGYFVVYEADSGEVICRKTQIKGKDTTTYYKIIKTDGTICNKKEQMIEDIFGPFNENEDKKYFDEWNNNEIERGSIVHVFNDPFRPEVIVRFCFEDEYRRYAFEMYSRRSNMFEHVDTTPRVIVNENELKRWSKYLSESSFKPLFDMNLPSLTKVVFKEIDTIDRCAVWRTDEQ